jgi:hypothetical protein
MGLATRRTAIMPGRARPWPNRGDQPVVDNVTIRSLSLSDALRITHMADNAKVPFPPPSEYGRCIAYRLRASSLVCRGPHADFVGYTRDERTFTTNGLNRWPTRFHFSRPSPIHPTR